MNARENQSDHKHVDDVSCVGNSAGDSKHTMVERRSKNPAQSLGDSK